MTAHSVIHADRDLTSKNKTKGSMSRLLCSGLLTKTSSQPTGVSFFFPWNPNIFHKCDDKLTRFFSRPTLLFTFYVLVHAPL